MLAQAINQTCSSTCSGARLGGSRGAPLKATRGAGQRCLRAPIGRNAPARPAGVIVHATAAPPALSSPFAAVNSEQELFALLKAGASSGQVPPSLIGAFNQLYGNYKAAVMGSGVAGADEAFVARVMASVCERVMLQLNPATAYTFPSYHKSIQQPYNYYNFGQRYIRGLVDFSRSRLGHAERFAAVQAQLAAGHNVVLLANHQTEADPAVFALLLEAQFPGLASEVIYVAGDRVVTDPLCAPFSMGRNLFCVHSKKHLDDVPELKAEKQAVNRRTLKAMQVALNEGGKLLWIAPSGGRDRRRDAAGETAPDEFDPSAVELMRALLAKAKPQGHLWPFAMYSYRVMPPPDSVEVSIGEERRVFHAPVGIALCPELDPEAVVAAAGVAADDKEGRQAALAQAAWEAAAQEYVVMQKAIASPESAAAAGYSQPWLNFPAPPLDQWL